MTDDPLIGKTEEAKDDTDRAARAANLFDLRRIIGALFVVYGVILTIVGITDSRAEIDKAAGIQINLWTGLAMLAVGAFFLVWAQMRPLSEELSDSDPSGGGPGGDDQDAGEPAGSGRE